MREFPTRPPDRTERREQHIHECSDCTHIGWIEVQYWDEEGVMRGRQQLPDDSPGVWSEFTLANGRGGFRLNLYD